MPNIEFVHKNGINVDSHPAEWVNMFFPWKSDHRNEGVFDVSSIATHTNMRINCCLGGKLGGGKKCGEFSVDEIMSFFGLYMLNGLNPSPQVHLKFKKQKEDEVQGSDLCYAVFGNQAEARHVQFKSYLTLVDPRTPIPKREQNPNYKINPIVKQLIGVSKKAMIMGEWISVDEQTIGFKGNHVDKLRINYKKAGDGFQCDVLCADGYTFTVYFRNVAAPKDLLDKGLSPLHSRVVSMFSQLPVENYKAGMDNLYMSAKLALFSMKCRAKVHIHGVTRQNGRGIPEMVHQEPKTRKNEILASRGTLKVAELKNESTLKGLVAMSLYDTKPFYFITNCWEKIEWIKKERKVWSKQQKKMVKMAFYRLNIMDTYNYNMNNVDIADQLAGVYRWDHWMRKRKWWWSIMFWALQQMVTNAYIAYTKYIKLHRMKPISHYAFLEKVALVWLKEGSQFFRIKRKRKVVLVLGDQDEGTIDDDHTNGGIISVGTKGEESTNTMTRGAVKRIMNAKNSCITDGALDPFKGSLKCRLDHNNVRHMPSKVPGGKHKYCQLNYWATKKKKHAQLLKCEACGVNLCVDCYALYHTEANLVGRKESLKCGEKK